MGGRGIALAAALALLASAAGAQDAVPAAPVAESAAAEPAPAAAAAKQGRMIEEIIVTAQKREENIRDVPISVSALDSNFIAEQAITDFRDVSIVVPNVAVDNLGEFNDIRIRGFGSPLSNKAFEQSVGLVIDGVAYGRREYFLGPLFDLERVEVLRGPQGTLFGKNTTAGLFNVVTKQPTDEYTGEVAVEYGEFDRQHYSLAVGGPIVKDVVNFRFAALAESRDGYVENTTAPFAVNAEEQTSGRDRKGFRAQLGFPDIFGVKLNLSYEHVDVDLDAGGWEFRLTKANVRPFFRQWDANADFTPFNYKGSIDETLDVAQTFDTFTANASYDLGGWTLSAVGGYAKLKDDFKHADPDFTPAPIFFSDDKDSNPQTTAEVRATSPTLPGFLGLGDLFGWSLGTTELTVGFFHQHREINDSVRPIGLNVGVAGQFLLAQGLNGDALLGLVPVTVFPPGIILPIDLATTQAIFGAAEVFEETTGIFEQSGSSYAGFGQMDWQFLDRWTLQYGMRLTSEDKEATNSRVTTAGTGVAFSALGLKPFTQTLSRDEFAFTPKVGVIHEWSDDVSVFATWAKGFKSGGFNELASNNDDVSNLEYEPEKTTSYEVGTKARLFDGVATANLSLYWQDNTDLQVFTVQPSSAVVSVTNAGKARSRGAEFDGAWLANDWLTLRTALAFTDARYIEFPFGDCNSDFTDTDGDGDPRCDLSDQPLYRTPKWTVALLPSVRYPLDSVLDATRFPLFAQALDVVGGITAEYEDVQFTDRTNNSRSRQEPFWRFAASIGLENREQGWSIRVHGENLTDEDTVTQTREVTLGPGNLVHMLEPPRSVFGSFRWAF